MEGQLGAGLEDKKVLILGATGPIGSAISLALAKAGAELILHGGRDGAALDQLASACWLARKETAVSEASRDGSASKKSAKGEAAPGEAAQGEEPSPGPGIRTALRAFSRAAEAVALVRELPAPDILVCALGPFIRGSLAEQGPEAWSAMAELGLALPGALVSALLPGMRERGYGRFLLFGSTAGEPPRGVLSNAAYSAAKAGLAVIARSLALEAGGKDLACTVICPGFVDSPGLDPAFREGMKARAPGGRLQDPSEIADLALWVLSRPASLLSGAVIRADGGLTL